MNESNRNSVLCVVTALLLMMPVYASSPAAPGVLKAEFIYDAELDKNPLTKGKCKRPEAKAGLAGIATDVVVSLVGKVTESLIDAAAAKTQPEATTLEYVIPLEGFYDPKSIVVNNGCLVFHNGTNADASDASMRGIFQVVVSEDSTAFRFNVVEWHFDRFLKPDTSHWAQTSDVRDFDLKFEFFTPGSDGIGTRRVFVEHPLVSVDVQTISKAFQPGQKLPWFAVPPPASGKMTQRSLPLNLAITVVESTKPNQFATWIQQAAKDKKADVSAAVQDAVRKSLDPTYAATQQAKSATDAATAYTAYKSAWDAWMTQRSAKPADLSAGANESAKVNHTAALAAWNATMIVDERLTEAKRIPAKAAYSMAGLSWPGDLPAVP